MENVALDKAKVHLEELIERAAHGEDVRISDPKHGTIRLMRVDEDERPRKPRRLGLLEGKMKVPERLMEPMTEEELKDWYGDGA